ncbi:conserved Plasmodium protein, unknown function [Plasmodium berghei]|uniref:Uncharacterized protein n=2 Tax=Plasmodium berghei TaxID=5821 RepID=A0A509AFC9_PLABA|nr:conserved Plasmodium protein, unknown function [Plasmodium berghei ANKA]CXH89637.1 conserved Plasmodium protein, unknown function [Plasmodium berghei]SCL90351.1 conserved Plasmodium protein, unknown function [Plasmodium berghei]SCM15276.1 conserved Plasmodium protein, unknown function [Plasmodium berghei]SCM17071.1 conserved Plasmodium protein, unknown function [Plasmodium berghei]SCN21975.1 conserved Plasmodium protein, unknown function [Plasmodium berghei]|eukprot:XP_034419851.1 conserved Plasmodium protein, unknown function [Plasmodium berghei ANKA]
MHSACRFLRAYSSAIKHINNEELQILKKKLRYKFKSVGMLELDTLINNYINSKINTIDKGKEKLLYNLMEINTVDLLKLFYFYSNKNNNDLGKLSEYLKDKDEQEVKNTFTLLTDILHNNENTKKS